MTPAARRICDHSLGAGLLALALMPGQAARAGELSFYGGAGAALSSGGDPGTRADLSLYAGVEAGDAYLEASADHYNDSSADEVDVTLGYGATTAADLTYDLSVSTALLPDACCATLDLSLSQPLGEAVTAGFAASHSLEDHLSEAHLSLDYDLTDRSRLSGALGLVPGTDTSEDIAWDLGLRVNLREDTAVKLVWSDSSQGEGRLGLTLSWERQLFGP